MKILLFGKHGQVGWELHRSLALSGEVIALDSGSKDFPADFSRPGSLVETVRTVRPEVIVNAAAYTAVDKAESEADLAHAINADAPGVLATEAARLGSTLIHYSTDYVFDGTGEHARDEDAPTAPLSVYGQTKLEGENPIRESRCTHVILRTSWVYASRGSNFMRTMLRIAMERDRLTIIDDQVGAPTGAELLADLTAHVVRAIRTEPGLSGTYHAVAGGETSWYDYARFLIERARRLGYPVKVAPEDIEPIPTSEWPTPAPRPLNSRLATVKLRNAFGVVLPDWETGVDRALTEILDRGDHGLKGAIIR